MQAREQKATRRSWLRWCLVASLLWSVALAFGACGTTPGGQESPGQAEGNTNPNDAGGQDSTTLPTESTTADAGAEPSTSPDTQAGEQVATPEQATPPDTPTGTDGTPELPPGTLTWYKDILPIVQKRCQGCHTSGGIGPFTLVSYDDVKTKGTLLKWVIETRRMPPWMPDEQCQPVRNSRRLSELERTSILNWIAQKMPEGNPADAPPNKPKPDSLDWVDKTVAPTKSYLPAKQQDRDDYHCVVIDPKLTKDVDLIGYEVIPGARAIVHHVIVHAVDLAKAKANETAPGAGYTCYGGPKVSGSVMVGGWVPGTTVTKFPTGTGINLKAGTGFVMQIHYNFDSAKAAADLTSMKLQFSKTPIPLNRRLLIFPVADGTLRVPPQSQGIKASNTVTLPAAGRIWGAIPHMHALGTSIRVDLADASGKPKACLAHIPKWDFNWQQSYFYSLPQGLVVEKGDRVTITCTYDNPNNNTVTWGESTTDEMCLNYLYATLGKL